MKYLRYYGVVFDQIFKRGGYVLALFIINLLLPIVWFLN